MILKRALVFYLLIPFIMVSAFAQAPPPPGGGNTDDVGAPIDENIWIAIISAVGLGLYYILSKKSPIKN